MRHVLAIAKRELISYLLSPIGYIVAFLFIGFYSLLFYTAFTRLTDSNAVIENGLSMVVFFSLLAIPFLTMGLLADERKSGTIEMLMTAPLADWEVVLGKYLGSVIYIFLLVLPSAAQIIAVRMYGLPEWGPVISGYIGLALLLLLLAAMGLFFSSISKSPLVAAVLSLVFFFVMFIISFLVPEAPPAIETTGNITANLLHYAFAGLWYASLADHFANLGNGLVNTRDVAYFISGTVFFLFLATLAVESRKWK
jgi:ABC-2 type transport system permease protein